VGALVVGALVEWGMEQAEEGRTLREG